METDKNQEVFERIASALERISPASVKNVDLDSAEGFVFESKNKFLKPVYNHKSVNTAPIYPKNTFLDNHREQLKNRKS